MPFPLVECAERYVRCDISNYRQLDRVFRDLGPFDFVYHAAAEFGRWNGEDYFEQMWMSNAVGMKNIIRLQERLNFRLVHLSSSEVYGDWPAMMVESVTDSYDSEPLNDYALSKWVNEMQIRNSAIQFGTETVVVRLFNVYGPGEHYSPYRSVNYRFLYAALKGLPWKVFKGHYRTSTYISDAVRTLANIPKAFIPGETYNIGGTEYHSIEELSDLVLEVTRADRNLVEFHQKEILTTKRKFVDVSKAIRDLGHDGRVDLREGTMLTANWMRGIYEVTKDA